MTVDRWAQAVRHQLGIGRLVPLGGPGDGAWIAESAARDVLRLAAAPLRGVRLGSLRLEQADPEGTYEAAVPAPPGALPPGPLRIVADCAAAADEPLPVVTTRLRMTLARVAGDELGLVVEAVDLQVTELLEAGSEGPAGSEPAPDEPSEPRPLSGDEARAAQAARSVPGVAALTGALGGMSRAVHIEEPEGGTGALPRRHVRVELAVSARARALDVARQVRRAVTTAFPDAPTVAVLVTGVERP
ncbi:nucleopolyhedrovirus P10 family protein [Streptomyces sp. NPDC016845]|uniref:nucleopolyhedrovirus P10 family protein n=1 Tax=Streptomyces sp. NPDC016845 TaxID=3364972 RepID=UPI0037B72FF3